MELISKALLCLLCLTCAVESARILGIFTMPGRSHYILGSSLMRGLADRGHDVTVVSSIGEKTPPKNGTYRDIVLTGYYEEMQEHMKSQDSSMFDMSDSNPFVTAALMVYFMNYKKKNGLEHENFQKLLKSNEKFDVVIMEQFMNDAQKAVATHFGAPLIVFSSIGANFWVNPLVGNPSPPSYIPDVMLEYSSQMTFCERLINSLIYVFNQFLYHCFVYPKQNQLIKSYIPNGPDIYDVLYNASIVLMNSHTSLHQPVPYVPNMIEIGGYHVQPPKKLPQDLQEFLDNAKDGVIYFSMGSNLKSAQLPIEKREAILKTFSKLKQQILWKWEDDVLPSQPSNVKLSKWLPQQDVLAHPNVRLFITHGGLLSTTETVYHGVPILAIPVFGDQKLNARVATNNGFGLVLPYSELSEETLTRNINEILDNPKFKENAKKRSQIYHDRAVSPMDTAAYWVEYVVRHGGAPHLRVAALDLPWYKYHLLDVIGFVALISLSSLLVSCYVLRKICRKFCSKKEKKIKKN